MVPILPFILEDRISLPHNKIQSHVSALLAAYAGASVLFSLPAGVIADKLPTRQLPFLVGLTALLLATLLLLLGQNVAVLVVARILQGISAAVVWTIGLALVLDTVGPENLGKTIGSVGNTSETRPMHQLREFADIWLHFNRRAGSTCAWRRRLQPSRIWRRLWPWIRYPGRGFYHATTHH